MQKLVFLFILLISTNLTTMAQKDINAWKSEQSIEEQYSVFKENLNFWDGKYFMNEDQLNDYYASLSDTVLMLEQSIANQAGTIRELQNELRSINDQLDNTQSELDNSIKNRNSIEIFGLLIDKGIYTLIMSLIIFGLIVLLMILFFLYKKSNRITVKTKKDFAELKEEFEAHKKESLERYTKINMELHHTRLQLNKK